jgi:hypothetical protein
MMMEGAVAGEVMVGTVRTTAAVVVTGVGM